MEATPMVSVLAARAAPMYAPSSLRANTLTINRPIPKPMNGMWASANHLGGTLPMVNAMITSTAQRMLGRMGSQMNSSATDNTTRLLSLIDGFHRVSMPGSAWVEGCWMFSVVIPALFVQW